MIDLVDPRQPTDFELTTELSQRLEEEIEFQVLDSFRRIREYGWVGAKEEDIGSAGNTPERYRQQLKDFYDLYGQLYPAESSSVDGEDEDEFEEQEEEDEDEDEDEDVRSDDSVHTYICDCAGTEDESGYESGAEDGDTTMVESEAEAKSEIVGKRSDCGENTSKARVNPMSLAAILLFPSPETNGENGVRTSSSPMKSSEPSPLNVLEPSTSINIGHPRGRSTAVFQKNGHGGLDAENVRFEGHCDTGSISPEPFDYSMDCDLKSRKRCATLAAEEGDENKRPR